MRISRVRIAGMRVRRRASFKRADLPGQSARPEKPASVARSCAYGWVHVGWRQTLQALNQLRCQLACSDSGAIGRERAGSGFHPVSDSIWRRCSSAGKTSVRRSLRSRPTPAQRGAQLPVQGRRKACRCSVSGAGTAPEAGGLGQGVSSNDNTMPGFSTARLSRPLLVSSVVTVTP